MITTDQVETIIAAALDSAGSIPSTLSNEAYAQRFAIALDALGLLQFCDINEPDQSLNTPPPFEGLTTHRDVLGTRTEHTERRDRSADR